MVARSPAARRTTQNTGAWAHGAQFMPERAAPAHGRPTTLRPAVTRMAAHRGDEQRHWPMRNLVQRADRHFPAPRIKTTTNTEALGLQHVQRAEQDGQHAHQSNAKARPAAPVEHGRGGRQVSRVPRQQRRRGQGCGRRRLRGRRCNVYNAHLRRLSKYTTAHGIRCNADQSKNGSQTNLSGRHANRAARRQSVGQTRNRAARRAICRD